MISQFYKQFSLSGQNLDHIGSSKNFKLIHLEHKHIIYHFEAVLRKHFRILRNSLLILTLRYLNIIHLESPDQALKNDI